MFVQNLFFVPHLSRGEMRLKQIVDFFFPFTLTHSGHKLRGKREKQDLTMDFSGSCLNEKHLLLCTVIHSNGECTTACIIAWVYDYNSVL